MNEVLKAQTGAVTFNFFDPQQFETMQRVCKMFARSELVPDMYKVSGTNTEDKAVANCMIAISMSMRIGADPLMIMQNMVIIYGKPSWSSKFLIATVNSCGRYNPLKYKFENLGKLGKVQYTAYDKVWIAGQNGNKGYYKNNAKIETFDGTNIDNIRCFAFASERGSQELLEGSEVSIEMAVKEGWYTKSGSKWPTIPKQMLMYRAASFWTSAYAPDLSMGMKTEEEVRDIVDIEYEDVTGKDEKEKSENANKGTMSFNEDDKKADSPAEQDSPETSTTPPPTPKITPPF